MTHCKRILLVLGMLLPMGCTTSSETGTPSPFSVTLVTGEVGRSTVALSPDDSLAHVAWVERQDSVWNVMLGTADRMGNLVRSPVRVNETPGNAAVHAQAPPQVGVDTQGRVYVAWINRIDVPGRRFPANDLFVAVSEDGGETFGSELPINSDFGGTPAGHTFHNLTALPDGSMLVSWIDSRDRSPAPNNAAMADQAAMHEHSGSQIRVARIEEGGDRIVETAILDRTSCPCCRTFITVTPEDRILVAWRHEYASGERDVVVAHSDDGGRSFSDWRPIHRDHWFIEGCPHTGPVLATDSDGRIHAAWYTGADGGDVRHAVSTDGGLTFEQVKDLLSDVPVAQAAFLTDTGKNLLLMTENPRSRTVVPRSATGHNTTGWTDLNGELPSTAAGTDASVLTWRHGNEIRLLWNPWS